MTVQYLFEVLGTAFFAISGALAANKKSTPDWFGVTFIGFITAIGGGSLRDVLLGSYPIVWVKDVYFIYAILVGTVLASIFYKTLHKLRKTLFLFDTLGIALFTIVGTEKALSLGAGPETAAMMGMFSAVMGGVLRDMLTQEVPIIFHKEIYATACLAGALLYLMLHYFGISRNINFWLSGSLIVAIRILAVRYNLSLPKFRRQTV
ncbi:trimeric intracellular cation channel family protein [Flavobacterium subsaxonicum]|uniref:Membrane protein n=1 Tax=Flavobacterium subsaxonicum WB 4.1-42 = DSM 21790 TaxID=1121898 RepID=A0A0A2N396_9FLAO|nr:trimeric intracellular cation channel family protein [Flavobacterium subsaxonicum]KGO94935.1 membrane protein [Flavobacterium subsaxonicum WB 4.1-42 = DSM 21790]